MEPTFVICSVYHNVWTALDVPPPPSLYPSVFNFLVVLDGIGHCSREERNFEMTIPSYDIKISSRFESNFIENTQGYGRK